MSPSVEVLTGSQLSEVLTAIQHDIAALEEGGYTLVGGVKYTTRGLSSKAVLMMGPARDRAATLAQTLLGSSIAIASAFSENRRLVSRNGSFWKLPAWELCNDLPAADARRLDEAHSAALRRLQDIFVPRIRPAEATIKEMAAELAAYLRQFEASRSTYGPTSGFGKLGDDSRSIKRIKRWRSAEPPLLN